MKALLVLALPAIFGYLFGDPVAQLYSVIWLLVLAAAGAVDMIRRCA